MTEQTEKTEQICPSCGCFTGLDAYEKDGLFYCCEPCAENNECECGCCDEEEEEYK